MIHVLLTLRSIPVLSVNPALSRSLTAIAGKSYGIPHETVVCLRYVVAKREVELIDQTKLDDGRDIDSHINQPASETKSFALNRSQPIIRERLQWFLVNLRHDIFQGSEGAFHQVLVHISRQYRRRNEQET